MLKGSFFKSFKYQTIVTADILLRLDKYLKTRVTTIVYNYDTADGAMYETNDIEDILQYTNNSKSQIERITINGKREGKFSLQSFITVKFFDKRLGYDSASLFIYEASYDEISCISKELIDIINLAKAPHSWVYSKWFLMVLNLILSGILSIALYTYIVPEIKENNPAWWIEITIFQMFILAIIYRGFMKTIEWAYPETVFSIGEQETSYKKIISRRNKIVGGLCTIILGVISSIIASKFFN